MEEIVKEENSQAEKCPVDLLVMHRFWIQSKKTGGLRWNDEAWSHNREKAEKYLKKILIYICLQNITRGITMSIHKNNSA